jgi:hypothetical protein
LNPRILTITKQDFPLVLVDELVYSYFLSEIDAWSGSALVVSLRSWTLLLLHKDALGGKRFMFLKRIRRCAEGITEYYQAWLLFDRSNENFNNQALPATQGRATPTVRRRKKKGGSNLPFTMFHRIQL